MGLNILSILLQCLVLVVNIDCCPQGSCVHGHAHHTACGWGFCSCTCDKGWTGDCCSDNIDDCQGISCNNGTCQDGLSSYNCSCDAGYTGAICDTEINECASNPCQHSGVCFDDIDKFVCSCHAGYTGANCESDINECARNPCQNQGRCRDRLHGYTCVCAVGFTGTNCEINIACHSKPCLNNGMCTDDQEVGFTCHCPLGFKGNICEKEPIDMVKPNIILPETQIVSEGQRSFSIPCYAEGIPVPTITWEPLDKPSLPYNTKQLAHFLIFKNVSTINGGHYMCTAKNKVGTDIKVVRVIVQAQDENQIAPIIHALSSVHIKYYSEGRLTCNITGFPTPTVIWKHNNNVVQSSGHTLVIHSVTNATTGTYTCIATNDAGSSQANIHLKATFDAPKIITSPVTSVIMAGHSKNFTCIATGDPNPSITWTYKMYIKHTTDMPSNQVFNTGSVLTLFSINAQESGQLTCTAQNEFGEDHVSVSVIVRSPIPVG